MTEGSKQQIYVDGKFHEQESQMQKFEDSLVAFKMGMTDLLADYRNKIQELCTAWVRPEEETGNGKGIMGSTPGGPTADLRVAGPTTDLRAAGSSSQVISDSLMKPLELSFPKFDGTDPNTWFRKCNRYFLIHPVPPDQKVLVASSHFEKQAEIWFQSHYNLYKEMSWREFKEILLNRFLNMEQEDNIGEPYRPSQTSTVTDYIQKPSNQPHSTNTPNQKQYTNNFSYESTLPNSTNSAPKLIEIIPIKRQTQAETDVQLYSLKAEEQAEKVSAVLKPKLGKDAEIWSVQKKEGILALVNIVQEQKKDEVLNIANLKYEQEQLEDDTGKIGNIGEALKIRNDMVSNGMSSNAVTFNSLIQIFCKSGQMDHAKNVLEEMLSSDLPINQGAYTSVVHWLCINSRFDTALRFIKKMLLRNLRPGEGLLTLLVGGLCKTGKHTEAMELWFRLLEKGIAANTVTSNALIHGLCELGDMQKAVKLLEEMFQKSLGLDKITYNTLILSFCREGKLEEAFKLKGDMIKRRFQPEIFTYSLLLHGFYSLLTDKIRDNNLDQRRSRFGLARMIILHGYPLTTVEDVGFRVGVKNLQPLFELVTCVRIGADCMEVYAKEKQKVYEMLDKLPSKISLSADVSAVSSDSKASGDSKYLCLTAHFMDEDWQSKKTTFNFIPIDPSHTEDMHSEFILTCLMDWDIDRKLLPVTVDSGTSSDNMVSRIKDRLPQNRFLYLNGQLFEIRGGTNVVNLMVLRESNQYIRSPPSTQVRIKNYAYRRRVEREFHAGHLVYLRLQPYRQSTMEIRRNLKLAPRCSGLYQITKKEGIGVYHLLMPPEAQINSVFYIAQLKIQIGDRFTPKPQLPQAGQEGQLLAQPVAILHRKMINREKRGVQYQVQRLHLRLKLQLTHTRTEGQLLAFSVAILHRKMIKRGNREVTKYLVQRTSSSPEEVTWKEAEMNRKAPNSQIIHAGTERKFLVQSVAIEDRKLIKRNHKRVEQYLVLWSTVSPEATTWEVAEMHQRSLPPLILEDKDHFKEGRMSDRAI
ncbi:hypothetical protein ACOSQ2_015447 [Xanthoceras sorbifolium]